MKFISWNPAISNQYARYIPNQQLELVDIVEHHESRKPVVVESLPEKALSCFEWQYSSTNSLLAYGTSLGNLNVVDWKKHKEANIYSSSSKRLCTSISWNCCSPAKLAAGFENGRTNESCVQLFDIETSTALKIPSSESCCSLSWLQQHDSIVFTGNSMGWIKIFDSRSPNNVPALSWLAHPANRPRKVKGLHPCLLDGNILASFSDAVGDFVKVWDLRLIESTNRSQKKGGLPRCFSVNPYSVHLDEYNNNFVTSASISDIAWSPSRSEVLAVTTTHSKGILFFKCDVMKVETVTQPETVIPIASIAVSEPLKALSWQWIESSEINISRPSVLETFNKNLEKLQATATTPGVSNNWESIVIDYNSAIHQIQPTLMLDATHYQVLSESKRLLALTSKENVVDTDVREAVPFAFSEQKLVLPSRRGIKVFEVNQSLLLDDITTKSNGSEKLNELPKEKLTKIKNYMNDVDFMMKDRATAGYSFDASANLDILSEEMDFYMKIIENIYGNESHDFRFAELYSLTNKLQEIQRVWVWIDRIETSIHQTKLSLGNCGILSLFSSLLSSSSIISESLLDNATGAILFSSEVRSMIKKICGWLTFSDNESNNKDVFSPKGSDAGSLVSSEYDDGENKDLLEMLVEDFSQISFERASMLALWHGDLDLSVQVLHDAIESDSISSPVPNSYSNTQNQSSPQPSSEEDEDYMQTIALVASCIAGYYVKTSNDNFNNPSFSNPLMNWNNPPTSNNANSSTFSSIYGNQYSKNLHHQNSANHSYSSERSSWKTMCLLTINKLKKYRRNWVNYLIAGLNFLLFNIDESDKNEDYLLSSYSNILNDEKIFLEDRLSFASNYLNDKEFLSWMNSLYDNLKEEGNIEGLILTGITTDGIEILQNYLDRTSDIQTVALISTRILSSPISNFTISKDLNSSNHGVGSNNNVTSSINDEKENHIFQKISKWIYNYRQLLIKWECYTERAHLDIEISQRINKNNENKNKLMNSRLPSTSSHLNLLNSSQHGNRDSNQLNAVNPVGGAGNNQAGGNKIKMTTSHLGGKASQSLSMPVFEGIFSNLLENNGNNQGLEESMNFYYIKLKCNFCGQLLPSDDLPSKNMDGLRIQKSILNFCSNCNKQLPRCYVCQLYMGILNPYIKLKQAAQLQHALPIEQAKGKTNANPTNNYNNKDNAINNNNNNNNNNNQSTLANLSKFRNSQSMKMIDINFDRWFLFCQRCRHGGHTSCLTAWFSTCQPVSTPLPEQIENWSNRGSQNVCGVNGCNCECLLVT